MRLIRKQTIISIMVLTAGITLCKCGKKSVVNLIKADGSSTVFPITEAVSEEFQKTSGVKVTVGISGTGGGFKKFCRGETDVQNASRPILEKEMEECRKAGVQYYELPIAFDALSVVVNPANTLSVIKLEELKKMWEPASQGKVMKWKDVNAAWPDQPLKLYGAGADSGTFDYFTEAVNGKSKSSRGDYTASEDDNTLVQGISGDKFAIGYFGLSYYEMNKGKLKALAIDAGKGGVLPSVENVENGKYSPLSRPIFIYVNAKSAEKKDVDSFIKYYLENAGKYSVQAKYVSLPEKIYKLAGERYANKKTGTSMDGKNQVGVQLETILKRELKN